MSVFDWLEGVPLPNGASPYDVVEIRYKNNRKAYVRSPQAVTAHVGDVVVIDLQPGHDVGVVSLTGELVKSQLKLRKIKDDHKPRCGPVFLFGTSRQVLYESYVF